MIEDLEIRRVRHRARPAPPPPVEVAPATVEQAAARLAREGDPDDKVGYKKPPKAHQFKPGQSGNPKGRPKGARGANAIIREMLERRVKVRSNGKTKSVMTVEAVILKQLERALQGDARTADRLIALYRQAVAEEPAALAEVGATDLSETDDAILARFRRTALEDAQNEGEAS